MSGRLQSTLLTWPDSTVLQVCRVRSSVLRFDFSALPYLLRLTLWVLTERASPFGRFLVVSDHAGRRRAVSRGLVYSRSEKRVRVGRERHPLLGQASRSDKRVKVKSGHHPLLGQASRSEKWVHPLLGQFFRSETGSLFRPVVRYLDRPRSCASFVMSYVGPSFCWEANPLGTLGL